MHTRDKRIGADRKQVPRGRREQSRVVADTESHVLPCDCAARANQFDQIELGHVSRARPPRCAIL